MEGFGGFYGQTSLHPLALAVVLILCVATFVIRARVGLAPLMVAATTLPMAQRIIVAGADFTLMRVLLLAYLVRIFAKGENKDLKWNPVDTAIVLWTLAGVIVMTIHFGTTSALINRVGWAFDILVAYFAVRCLVRQIEDVLSLAKIIAIVSIPIAAFFAVETTTHRNLFSIFGGVPAETVMREGKFRCQGAFAHPILAGTFWASTLPMMFMLWRREGTHRLAMLGTAAAFVIIYACSSSTPMLSAAVAFGGLALFPYRFQRRRMWIGLIIVLTIIHFSMKQPVWHLMSRVDLVGGSTGWHRFVIFDAFINHFDRWYATGDHDPQSWGVWEMRDITNQFILEGLRGGLLTLLCYVLLLVRCFASVGKALTGIEHLKDRTAEKVIWLIGVTMLVHTFTFFGVSYFGQMTAILYIHFGLAGALVTQIMPNLVNAPGAPPPPEPAAPGRPGRAGRRRPGRLAPAARNRSERRA
jgi:hypothetical protein